MQPSGVGVQTNMASWVMVLAHRLLSLCNLAYQKQQRLMSDNFTHVQFAPPHRCGAGDETTSTNLDTHLHRLGQHPRMFQQYEPSLSQRGACLHASSLSHINLSVGAETITDSLHRQQDRREFSLSLPRVPRLRHSMQGLNLCVRKHSLTPHGVGAEIDLDNWATEATLQSRPLKKCNLIQRLDFSK
jgi:hypothetical protein